MWVKKDILEESKNHKNSVKDKPYTKSHPEITLKAQIISWKRFPICAAIKKDTLCCFFVYTNFLILWYKADKKHKSLWKYEIFNIVPNLPQAATWTRVRMKKFKTKLFFWCRKNAYKCWTKNIVFKCSMVSLVYNHWNQQGTSGKEALTL